MPHDFHSEPKVRVWKDRLSSAGCTLNELKPLHLVPRRNGDLLFGLFEASATDPSGHPILPVVLIRGDACVIVPLVRNRDTGEERFVMVTQRRIGSGLDSVEFPAGMVDREVDDPRAVIVKELHEETGLTVKPDDVVPLAKRPLFTSPGLQDEAIHFFGCVLELSGDEYRSLEGRLTGDGHEGERIRVTLKSEEEGRREASSAQVMLGFFLFGEWNARVN